MNSSGELPENDDWHEAHIQSHRLLNSLALTLLGLQAVLLILITYGLVIR